MTPRGIDEQRQAQLERLLSAASDFEPERPAPVGLAYRAMEQGEARQSAARPRRRHQPVALWAFLFGGAGAACATLALAVNHVTMPDAKSAARLSHQPPPAATPRQEPPAQFAFVAPSPTSPESPQPAVTADASAPNPVRRAASERRKHARGPARFTALRREARPPAALWEEVTVQREIAHVGAPGWLVERDAADDTWVLTPGRVDLVMPVPAVTPEADDSSSSRLETSAVACDTPAETPRPERSGAEAAPHPPAPPAHEEH